VTGQSVTNLEAVSREKPPYREDWLQDLIHRNPDLVPAGEVEAAFADLVPSHANFPLAPDTWTTCSLRRPVIRC
jgi:hypothetical protein